VLSALIEKRNATLEVVEAQNHGLASAEEAPLLVLKGVLLRMSLLAVAGQTFGWT